MIKLKNGLLGILTVGIVFFISSCSFFDKVNKPPTVSVNLIQDQPETIETEYLVRFDLDSGSGTYVKLKDVDENILLTGWDIQTPKDLQILERNAQVNLTTHIVQGWFGDTQSDVYQIKTKLTMAAAAETTGLEFKSNVVAHFPAIPQIRARIAAQEPTGTPEIRFEVSHYTRYSKYGAARLIPYIISSFWPAVGVLFTSAWLSEELSKADRSISKWLTWLVTFVVIGVVIYFSFFILRDLWWIVSGLWGG